jgi:DNA-binding GntR family transcriptional regulator
MPPSLKEVAAAYLREQIMSGQLLPGSRADSEKVSAALGMSRVPVREAIIELTQEGLLEFSPRRGAFVAELAPEDILDQYRIYGLVAGLLTSRAASALGAEDHEALQAANESFARASSPEELADANEAFHGIIYRAGGSQRLLSLLDLLGRSFPEHFFEVVPESRLPAVSQHQRILEALGSGHADKARRMMEHHHMESGRLALEVLRKAGYWDAKGRSRRPHVRDRRIGG